MADKSFNPGQFVAPTGDGRFLVRTPGAKDQVLPDQEAAERAYNDRFTSGGNEKDSGLLYYNDPAAARQLQAADMHQRAQQAAAQLAQRGVQHAADLAQRGAEQVAQTAHNNAILAQRQAEQAAQTAYNNAMLALSRDQFNYMQQADKEKLAVQAAQLALDKALGVARVMTDLRGPSNAFKQQEVAYGLNQAGLSNAMGVLAGTYSAPAFGADQGVPEAATVGTMIRDFKSSGGVVSDTGDFGGQTPTGRYTTGNGAKTLDEMRQELFQVSGGMPDKLQADEKTTVADYQKATGKAVLPELSALPAGGGGLTPGQPSVAGQQWVERTPEQYAIDQAYNDALSKAGKMTMDFVSAPAGWKPGMPVSLTRGGTPGAPGIFPNPAYPPGTAPTPGVAPASQWYQQMVDWYAKTKAAGGSVTPEQWVAQFVSLTGATPAVGKQMYDKGVAFINANPTRQRADAATQQGWLDALAPKPVPTPGTPGTMPNPAYPPTPGAVPSPGLTKDYLDSLVAPNQASVPGFLRLNQSTQGFILGGYEAQGRSKQDVLDTFKQVLPQSTPFAAPSAKVR